MNPLAMLAIDAHRIAVEHGFWHRDNCSSPVATKVALIHTEICEWGDDPGDIEELADIVIRTADLAAALDVPQRSLSEAAAPIPELSMSWERDLHGIAAQITQHDRRNEIGPRNTCIAELISACFKIARINDYDLWPYINEKMEKNRRRPRLHGRAY